MYVLAHSIRGLRLSSWGTRWQERVTVAGSGAENSKQAFEAGIDTHGPCSGPLLPAGAYLLEGPQPPKTRSPAEDPVFKHMSQ